MSRPVWCFFCKIFRGLGLIANAYLHFSSSNSNFTLEQTYSHKQIEKEKKLISNFCSYSKLEYSLSFLGPVYMNLVLFCTASYLNNYVFSIYAMLLLPIRHYIHKMKTWKGASWSLNSYCWMLHTVQSAHYRVVREISCHDQIKLNKGATSTWMDNKNHCTLSHRKCHF